MLPLDDRLVQTRQILDLNHFNKQLKNNCRSFLSTIRCNYCESV